MAIFLSQIKLARLRKGIRQADLARIVGVDVTTISKFENLKMRPSLVTLQRLSMVLGTSLDELAKDFEPQRIAQ